MAKKGGNRKYYSDPFLYAERREELIEKAFNSNSKAGSNRYRKMLANLDRGYAMYQWGQIKKAEGTKPERPQPIKYETKGKTKFHTDPKYTETVETGIEDQSRSYSFNSETLINALHKTSRFLDLEGKIELVRRILDDIEIIRRNEIEEAREIVDDSTDHEYMLPTNQYEELIDYIMKSGRIPYRAMDKLKGNPVFESELLRALIKKYHEKGNYRAAFNRAKEEFYNLMKERGMSNEYVDKIHKERYHKF